MGKKRATIIGSSEEEAQKAKRSVQREQKKLREGEKTAATEVNHDSPIVVESSTETVTALAAEPQKTSSKEKAAQGRSKNYKTAKSAINSESTYPITDGLALLRKVSLTKFDSTVELHIVLKKAPTAKLTVTLPHAFGKTKRVALATDEVVAKIEAGEIDFDLLVATPAQMGKLVKFAKVLGPRGLMPNPKTGTVSDKPEEAVKRLMADTSTALKLDKSAPVIHTTVGKLSLKDTQLSENIAAILATVPGNLKKVVLKSTMSPAIKLQA